MDKERQQGKKQREGPPDAACRARRLSAHPLASCNIASSPRQHAMLCRRKHARTRPRAPSPPAPAHSRRRTHGPLHPPNHRAQMGPVTLRLMSDNGARVFINGAVVANDLAADHEIRTSWNTVKTLPAGTLVAGTNVIAAAVRDSVRLWAVRAVDGQARACSAACVPACDVRAPAPSARNTQQGGNACLPACSVAVHPPHCWRHPTHFLASGRCPTPWVQATPAST